MDSCCALRAECRYKTGPAIAIRIAQAQLPLLHLLCISKPMHIFQFQSIYRSTPHMTLDTSASYRYLL